MSQKLIRELERRIAKQVIDDLLAAGFSLYIDHGGEGEQYNVKDSAEETLDEVFACDDERLYVCKGKANEHNLFGWVWFVYGNDGWDVMSDWTVNLDPYLKNALAISEQYQD